MTQADGSVSEKKLRPQSSSPESPFFTASGIALLAVPVVAYLWLVHHYGVDGIWYDQWDDVHVIAHPTLGALWTQHNEGRLLFPNLVVLLLAHTSHFDIHVEAYVSALMLVVSVGLMVWTHKRRSGTPFLYYLPFVLLMLSFVQAQNSLWGFQMAWYLVMLAVAVAFYLLDRPALTTWAFAGSIVSAVVASYSSFQGLLIWPVGLILLYSRRRSRQAVIVWVGSALLTGIVFFYHYSSSAGGGNNGYAFAHPVAAIQFFFVLVGEATGQRFAYLGHNNAVLLLGIVIVALAIWTLCMYGFRQTESGVPFGVALICFGLLFAAITTVGRVSETLWAATGSRYTTFDLLIPSGCYLVLLERAPRWSGRPVIQWRISQLISIVTIALVMAVGIPNGITEAQDWHNILAQAATVTLNIDREPDAIVEAALSPGDSADVPFIRRQAQVARSEHLSVFHSP